MSEVEFACPYCDRRTAMLASSLAAFVGYGGRPPSWVCAPCWAARNWLPGNHNDWTPRKTPQGRLLWCLRARWPTEHTATKWRRIAAKEREL